MKVVAIMATCGRHTCCERSLRFFLDQDYKYNHELIIYQNSEVYQELGDIELPENKSVILINNHIDYRTGNKFETLGSIYNNVIYDIPEDADIVIFWDDDDIFLPNHISEGVKGYINASLRSDGIYKAYKPFHSYFRTSEGISLVNNTLEPSIFVDADVIRVEGFYDTTSTQHLKWVDSLVYSNTIYQDSNGKPTLCYNWGDTDIPTYKTSGNPDGSKAFSGYRSHSTDHGDRIITPTESSKVQHIYNLFNLN